MKKTFFIILFITTHIGFLILQIQKQTHSVHASYDKQKNERILMQLGQQKQALANKLQSLQNKHEIKEFAQNTLHLQPINLSQMQRLSDGNE